jgi:hypothetical protein
MELAGLFSGKAGGLLGRGVGSLTAQGVLGAPYRGNAYPLQVFILGFLAPGERVSGIFASPEPVLCGVPHVSESHEIQPSATPGLEVKQTFGYL